MLALSQVLYTLKPHKQHYVVDEIIIPLFKNEELRGCTYKW